MDAQQLHPYLDSVELTIEEKKVTTHVVCLCIWDSKHAIEEDNKVFFGGFMIRMVDSGVDGFLVIW